VGKITASAYANANRAPGGHVSLDSDIYHTFYCRIYKHISYWQRYRNKGYMTVDSGIRNIINKKIKSKSSRRQILDFSYNTAAIVHVPYIDVKSALDLFLEI
jgi:hypothetical protein